MKFFTIVFLITYLLTLSLGTSSLITRIEGLKRAAVIIPYSIINITGLFLCISSEFKYPSTENIYYESFIFSLPESIVISIFLSILFYFMIKNAFKSNESSSLTGIFCMVYFISAVIAIMGYFCFSNGYLDTSAEHTKKIIIIDKSDHLTRGGRSYHIFFKYLNDFNNSEEKKVKVKSRFYKNIKTGDQAMITVKKGYHGVEWVTGFASEDGSQISDRN